VDQKVWTLPWFRGTWAANGQPLVDGAKVILANPRFREAASKGAIFASRDKVTDALQVVPTTHGEQQSSQPLVIT
jgi:hypothetical protein